MRHMSAGPGELDHRLPRVVPTRENLRERQERQCYRSCEAPTFRMCWRW
jgi:hypothetical protein